MLIRQEILIHKITLQTKFDVGNFVNVTNIFGAPEIGFVSGSTEAFKRVNLYDTFNIIKRY